MACQKQSNLIYLHTPGDKNRPYGFDNCNLFCDPKTDKSGLIHAPVGTPCDDGYFCTTSACQESPQKGNVVCKAKSATENGPCAKSFCGGKCNEKTRLCENPCTDNSFCESACNEITQQCESPCLAQNFCNNTCNVKTQQCESPCKTSSCRSQPTCTDTDTPHKQGGTCGTSPLDSPPSCTTCPCDIDGDSTLTCNLTSGQCYRPNPDPNNPPNAVDKKFLPGVIGGVVVGVVVVIILVIVVVYIVRKPRLQAVELDTEYHNIDGEAE